MKDIAHVYLQEKGLIPQNYKNRFFQYYRSEKSRGPKIRVCSNPERYPNMFMDFYTDENGDNTINRWNEMTESFVKANPTWGRKKARTKYYIFKKGKNGDGFFVPRTEDEVIILCDAFLEMFEFYDRYCRVHPLIN